MAARRTLAILCTASLLAASTLGCAETPPEAKIYRSATCGCCLGWADHLEANGFRVEVIDLERLEGVKARLGIPEQLASCHTAEIEGYVVEGHVPAEDVKRLLRERPAVVGLAVPGMPEGSPGMEGPNPEPYTVWAFEADGGVTPFARHGS